MAFAGKIWRILVGIKDGLSLLFLLLFFTLLFGLLSARPDGSASIRDGALMIDLNGYLVEERTPVDPFQELFADPDMPHEYQTRDLVAALNNAAQDERIKAVVLDLSMFSGGGHVHLGEVGEALDAVRAAKKPVLTHAIAYGDGAMMLAAHASEIWVDPQGGAVIAGPGGKRLYYAELLDNLNIKAHVYKVGTYKSAVEPYIRNSMSDEARENYQALYGTLWEEWQGNIKKARPKIDLDMATKAPAEWIVQNNGNLAKAAMAAGLVDKLGDRRAFGDHVASLVGKEDWDESPGAFAQTDYLTYLGDVDSDKSGDAIGIVTIAGEIVDGEALPGTAGGERIAMALDNALDDDLKALVVRVDSPGGSVLASEEIRRAIIRHKDKDIPIVVSMANVAASGGYWVSTPADRIFAEPETITGSIGIFGVIPSFEGLAEEWGVHADGVITTPLTGQPDLIGGIEPEIHTILQSSIENGYTEFLDRVSESRGMSNEEVDKVGQGRVWDGGSARQIGLVDQYGGIEEALEWAAEKADLEEGEWHRQYLGTDAPEFKFSLKSMVGGSLATFADPTRPAGRDLFAQTAFQQQRLKAQMQGDLNRLLSAKGAQAYCLECPAAQNAVMQRNAATRSGAATDTGWMEALRLLFAG